ncbi:hypothetical protein MRX96_025857 [Rhipicephalus microplus]
MTGAADDQCCVETSPTGLHHGVSRDGASSRFVPWLLVSVLFVLCVLTAENRVDARHFTADELLRTKFPMRVSDDLDLDPCKSGDIECRCDYLSVVPSVLTKLSKLLYAGQVPAALEF